MVDAKGWCKQSLMAVSSLWNAEDNNHHAWRTSENMPGSQGQSQTVNPADQYFPTATFHAIAAFEKCGAWASRNAYNKAKETLTTPDVEVSDIKNFSTYDQVLGTLVTRVCKGSPPSATDPLAATEWVEAVLGASSHSPQNIKDGVPPPPQPSQSEAKKATSSSRPRQAIVIGHMFHALSILVDHAVREKADLSKIIESGKEKGKDLQPEKRKQYEQIIENLGKLLKSVEDGLHKATDYLCDVVRKRDIVSPPVTRVLPEPLTMMQVATASELSDSPYISPFVLLMVAIGVAERDAILRKLNLNVDPTVSDDIRKLKEVMGQYFTHEVDRLMSRRQIPLYPHYDAASLAFSMHGRVLMDESFRRSPLFRACVQAIVDDQNSDGTWPVGRSATFDDTGTSIQQPSIAVALSLAECLFRPELLSTSRSEQVEVLKIGLEALRKTGQYLSLTFTTIRRENGKKCYGWVSDRVRWPNVSETWITAMATRMFHTLWLAERVCARDEMLSKYGVKRDAGIQQADGNDLLKKWKKDVVDPDVEAKPADTLVEKVLEPIQKQLDEEVNFLRPNEDGVSFIIFGPPGSGKTYFVETFAKVLGWPLLTLNPGHFIRKGLELIEATSAEIFTDLLNLDHTVVFFDECDELFRARPKEEDEGAGRNILSFATASMLPKLQALHDARRVIFFLGTNYLQNVDDAIRRPGRFDDTLFFDRPDKTARGQLIQNLWIEEKGENEKLCEKDLKEGVGKTTGWMVKEVRNYAKALIAGENFPAAPNIDDYLDWCHKRGKRSVGNKELDASRLKSEVKERIRERWKQIQDYELQRKERSADDAFTPQ